MNIDYVLLAAKTMEEKAGKEAANGLATASQSYTTAAKKYRQAAELSSTEKDIYIAKAEECEKKASQHKDKRIVKKDVTSFEKVGKFTPQRKLNSEDSSRNSTVSSENIPSVEESLEKLNALIGLNSVKETVKSWVAQLRVFCKRKELGLPVPNGFSYHLVFQGNPGTGKTTVARYMADIYHALGILKSGHIIDISRSGLVAGYEGQTAQKTLEVVDQALDGVLFIDEAYTLSGNGRDHDPFGQEAIDALIKAMEDYRDKLVVIVAGYTDLMEKFLSSNPGMKSRFNTVITFDDYRPAELHSIYLQMCNNNKYILTTRADELLVEYFEKLYANRNENFGNGRTVRNIFELTVRKQSQRVDRIIASGQKVEEKDLVTINEDDILSIIHEKSKN